MRSLSVKLLGSIAALAITVAASEASADTIFYTSESAFDAAIGTSITDHYDSPGYFVGPNPDSSVLTNEQMNKVFGETRYTTTGFKFDTNTVIRFFPDLGSPGYCAGCNGSFILDFRHTSVGTSKGVYGVGFDFINYGPPLFLHNILHLSPSETNLQSTNFFRLVFNKTPPAKRFSLA